MEVTKGLEYVPKLTDFGFTQAELVINEKDREPALYSFEGGEDKALEALESVFGQKSADDYQSTVGLYHGTKFTSKLSPWIANGSLSPRKVYYALTNLRKTNKYVVGTLEKNMFINRLQRRDFYRFWCMNPKNNVFAPYDIYDPATRYEKYDLHVLDKWRKGKTGRPVIDAFMREMNATGYMPNSGRTFVARYLALDLKQDWRYGAYYFEEKLIDHDVHSNYCGWKFFAGLGPTSGQDVVHDAGSQAHLMDQKGERIRQWCPELKAIEELDRIHEPWRLSKRQQKQLGVLIGLHYPALVKPPNYTSLDDLDAMNNHPFKDLDTDDAAWSTDSDKQNVGANKVQKSKKSEHVPTTSGKDGSDDSHEHEQSDEGEGDEDNQDESEPTRHFHYNDLEHYIVGMYPERLSLAGSTDKVKLALFDLDWTLIKPKSGKRRPESADDWQFLRKNTITKLKEFD